MGGLNVVAGLVPSIAPAPYRRHRRHAERGDHEWVVATTATTLAELGEDAAADRWGPGVLVRLGSALARRQQLTAARTELTRALGALDGSLAATDLGGGESASLQLAEVLAALGEFGEARARGLALWEPRRHLSTRAGAARLLASLHLAGGDVAGAHAWLDEAATRAASLGGELPLALVHADRSVVVTVDGRIAEGVAMATEALNRLSRVTTSARVAVWADAQASSTACAIGIRCVLAGDAAAAEALATVAAERAVSDHRPLDGAWRQVLTSGLLRLGGDPEAAAAHADAATRTFAGTGAEPARAAAVREQALVAAAAGRHASARALLRDAGEAFVRLGMPMEAARTEALASAAAMGDNAPHGS